MGKIEYEIPSYTTNPDVPRELDKLVNSLQQQVMTVDDQSDLELRFQEQIEEVRSTITSLSESNAIPTLYQMSTKIVTPLYQMKTNEVPSIYQEYLEISINQLQGEPISQTTQFDLGEYIQVGVEPYLIYEIDSFYTYKCVRAFTAYEHNISIYDKQNTRNFDLVNNTVVTENLMEGYNFCLVYDSDMKMNKIVLVIKEGNNSTTYNFYHNFVEIPLFSVWFSKVEQIFKMWDGQNFIDFGHTFLPQSETYTKDEIDTMVGNNSNEISKREYKFESGSNVFIDREIPETPVLNVLNFDALDKNKDAITSLTAKKEDNDYQITLNTLSTAQAGGFKLTLPNISNDNNDYQLTVANKRISDLEMLISDLEMLISDLAYDSGWINLTTSGSYIETGSNSRIRRVGKVVYFNFDVKTKATIPQGTNVQTHLIPEPFRPSKSFTTFTVGIPSSISFYNCSLAVYPTYMTFKCPTDTLQANISLYGTATWLVD